MSTFYKQTSDATQPESGQYTDFAIYKDGSLKIANENGTFVTPFSLNYNPPYIANIADTDWVTGSTHSGITANYSYTIPEATHQRGQYAVVTAVYLTGYMAGSIQTVFNASKTTSGDITIYSDNKVNCQVYIDRVYPQIQYGNAIYAQVWVGTQSEYDALESKDSTTIYLIKSE